MTTIPSLGEMPTTTPHRFWLFKSLAEAELWAKEKGIDLSNAVWAEKQRALGIPKEEKCSSCGI
jgi:hypothetical protein